MPHAYDAASTRLPVCLLCTKAARGKRGRKSCKPVFLTRTYETAWVTPWVTAQVRNSYAF
jgi:hypothetical protein